MSKPEVCRCGWEIGELVGRLAGAGQFFSTVTSEGQREFSERRRMLMDLGQNTLHNSFGQLDKAEKACGIKFSAARQRMGEADQFASRGEPAGAEHGALDARRYLAMELNACQARK